ncbi:MAG: hypothetical protein ACK5CA_10210 [Cyanobacteriota bacterium]|jgi:hypothetical protein
MVFSSPPDPSQNQNDGTALTAEESRRLAERERQVKNQANRWFILLLAVGLGLGGLTAWGVVKLLSNLGLTGPAQPGLSQPRN